MSLAGGAGAGGTAGASQPPGGAAALSNVSNPVMQQSEERLLTFVHWPSRIPVRPDQLSKAGFYYVGEERAQQWLHYGLIIRHWRQFPIDGLV